MIHVPLGGAPSVTPVYQPIDEIWTPINLGAPGWQAAYSATLETLVYRVMLVFSDMAAVIPPNGNGRYTVAALRGSEVISPLIDQWTLPASRWYLPLVWIAPFGRAFALPRGGRIAFRFDGTFADADHTIQVAVTLTA